MMKVAIIEDEPVGQKNLTNLIKSYCPDLVVDFIADSIKEGAAQINLHRPELIFLDIELPDGTGFDLLNKLTYKPYVIFVTAYQNFAIQAIKESAIDYILKPIDIIELQAAVNRAINLSSKTEKAGIKNQKLVIYQENESHFLDIDQILYCKSESNYSYIILMDNRKILTTHTLAQLEEKLAKNNFIRIHQSYLVNSKYISRYIKTEGSQIELTNGQILDVSRRKRDELKKYFDPD